MLVLRIKCTNCQHQCDFSEKIILTLFLKGLQDLLAEQDLDLVKCLSSASARETVKRSQDTINTPSQALDKISAYKEDLRKKKIPNDCCIGCGKKKHLMSIGRTGHYIHLCFRRGKPWKWLMLRISPTLQSTVTLSETCFLLQSHEAVVEDWAKQLH